MTTVRISGDNIATFFAEQWLNYQGVNDCDRKALLADTKYNVLVQGARASTVLLVSAVAATALLAFSAACSLIFVGLCARYVTETELVNYKSSGIIADFLGALGNNSGSQEWASEALVVCDVVLWRNTLPEKAHVAEGGSFRLFS